MSDRWNHHTVVVDNAKPIRVFMPGDLTETEHPAGFRVRVAGVGGTVVHAYRCPTHGLFDARVERADVPDEMPCPLEVDYGCTSCGQHYCGLSSPWAGSFCGQGKAAGECAT